MKTTVEISASLLAAARATAARDGTTVRALIEEGLRLAIGRRKRSKRDLRRSRHVIAVDTNLLVYAHRRDSEWHTEARQTVRGLAEGRESWAIPVS